ncbi:hypothetical protein OM076_25885 [Solirubrobacter ginsenosidimutans]|uniref:Uncharacterized protein n=1 Tax=Solirubrobacter ginsenosidimutans TaxID=490573 RepID=A0A9X3S3R5_9ACTN|nr:hypothetical protein [Solirubrobacter ginsenosidimutans]MDA0163727.1 hypothetical protein [Solirubrobacter ginsenosidimutans]
MSSNGEWMGMRTRLVAAASVTALALAIPAGAQAADMTMCQNLWGSLPGSSEPNVAFQMGAGNLGISVGGEVTDAVKAAVGAQYALLWSNDQRQGWSVAIAPGALDPDAARAAIDDRLSATLTAEQAAFLRGRLSVWATPYPEGDLRAIQSDVFLNALKPFDQGWGLDGMITCVPGDPQAQAGTPAAADGWRVIARLFTGDADPSQALLDGTRAAVAPYGDKVRLEVKRGDGRVFPASGPAPTVPVTPVQPPIVGSRPAPRGLNASRYVAVQHQMCVRGRTVAVKARRASNLRRLKVEAPNQRAVTLRPGKSTRVRVAGSGKTTISVTIATKGGRQAVQTYTFRHCA